MSDEKRTPTRQFVTVGDVYLSEESASEGEDSLQSKLLGRRMSSSEVDRGKNAIVAPLATQLKTLIQSLRESSERSSNRSTEGKRYLNDRHPQVRQSFSPNRLDAQN